MSQGRFWRLQLGLSLTLGLLTLLGVLSGLCWNPSRSMPPGLWRRLRAFDVRTDKGAVVLVCPPDTSVFRDARARGYLPWGRCPGGYAPVLKRVVAIPGDQVEVDEVVAVNGTVVPGSRRLPQDSAGRPLPQAQGGRVPAGQVWLLSTYAPRSFDSRYVGPIPVGHIRGVMAPLWLWE